MSRGRCHNAENSAKRRQRYTKPLCFVPVPVLISLFFVVYIGVMEDKFIDAVDLALDNEDMEKEIEEGVDKILSAIAGGTWILMLYSKKKSKGISNGTT
jgi:hypothetical protein